MSAFEKFTKNIEDAQTWLSSLLTIARNLLITKNNKKTIKLIENIQQTNTDISNNINVKLAIDNLAICWEHQSFSLD